MDKKCDKVAVKVHNKCENVAEKVHKKRRPKSFICKFSQAKLKAIGQRRAETHPVLPCEIVTKSNERQSCEPDIPLVQEIDFNDETNPLSGKSINDVRGEVSRSFQAWIRYPESIKNNK